MQRESSENRVSGSCRSRDSDLISSNATGAPLERHSRRPTGRSSHRGERWSCTSVMAVRGVTGRFITESAMCVKSSLPSLRWRARRTTGCGWWRPDRSNLAKLNMCFWMRSSFSNAIHATGSSSCSWGGHSSRSTGRSCELARRRFRCNSRRGVPVTRSRARTKLRHRRLYLT